MKTINEILHGNENDKKCLFIREQNINFYETACALQEDLIFLKMLVSRNTKSPFKFELVPTKNGMDRSFWEFLFHRSYSSSTNLDYVFKMLADYYLAKNFFSAICGSDIQSQKDWDSEVISAVYAYFKSMHNMDLADYASCFINCSQRCEDVINRCKKL